MIITNEQQEQRTPDWYRARLGVITGSQVGTLMKPGRSKDKYFSDTAESYICQLAAERALNPEIVNDDTMFEYYLDETSNTTKAMRFGIEHESEARDAYTALTGRAVNEVGLCEHDFIKGFGSSPDGIVQDKGAPGCVEIKCPVMSTFMKYVTGITDGPTLLRVNPDYYWQCMAHMACTRAVFCDFVVYNPFMSRPLYVVRIERDDNAIAAMEERVTEALKVIDLRYNTLIQRM